MLHTLDFADCPMSLECDSNGANCRCKEGFTEESECCDCAEDYYPSSDGTRCISKFKAPVELHGTKPQMIRT